MIEQAEDLMAQVRENLSANDFASALTLFMDLRPADQAELVGELRGGQQEEMLRSMTPEVAAGLLEHMEPEEAVEVFGGLETSALSAALDQTTPTLRSTSSSIFPKNSPRKPLRRWKTGTRWPCCWAIPTRPPGG